MAEQHPDFNLSPDNLPTSIPLLPLMEVVLFPKMVLPLIVIQKDYMDMIDTAMGKDRIIGLITAKSTEMNRPYEPEDIYDIGTVGLIVKMAQTELNQIQIIVQGISRFKVKSYSVMSSYLTADVSYFKDKGTKDKETEARMANIMGLYTKVVKLSPGLPQELSAMIHSIEAPGVLADLVASTINITLEEKQQILETRNVQNRIKKVNELINYQVEVLELGDKIQSQVKGDMDKRQREYYLRQQLKAIQEELGEAEDDNIEIEEFREKITNGDLPKLAKQEAERELGRLIKMHPSSSEYTVSVTYLDWLTSLPWNKSTDDNLDIRKAKKILDEDHFGLEKAKKRIIEHLAIRKLKSDSKGPILCFVGPPGTGKTSLGRSVAKAMGRNFHRISLGGVRDEAEIRGHRRTYVGSLPGRIIQGIRRTDANNPVFMLDEIDKVGSDFRGDLSSALLEVLDPEQNFTFSDHYLDIPFDLSKVMFITTANILDTIPPALLDRMEILKLSGYTQDEKLKIAQKYLIPRQKEAHGLNADQITFTKGAIKKIIVGYTKEAGLRNLEREIANICRGIATKIVTNEGDKFTIKMKDIAKYLGTIRFTPHMGTRINSPGVVMGLAWTQSGGEILYIEATAMQGNNGLTLTGQLGDVMKESATAALSYVRSNAKSFNLKPDFFKDQDIHIHVPAGAIPKDGPSAGVTMFTSIVSYFSNRPVKPNLAMTGEITLRGQLLPIGGIKEKILAAHHAGLTTVILPKQNKKDLEDIPKKVLKSFQLFFVDTMDEVIKIALEKK